MIVWSYGGGTQLAAIAVLVLSGKLPRPDIIVMADTGREVSATWDYLNAIVNPALSEIGLQVEIVPHSYASVDLFAKNGDILLPLYTRQNGGRLGKLPTFCSNEWKQYPIRRWLRERGIEKCDVWLGMSMDEVERMRPSGVKWYCHVYPLIEIVPLHRHQCYALVADFGWPKPPKSRCWMCPNMTVADWRHLAQSSPSELEQAASLEEELHKRDSDVYLHKYGIPLRQAVKTNLAQQEFDFDGCDGGGYCFV